jgi:O-antigen/teichoic acid export membrane protein
MRSHSAATTNLEADRPPSEHDVLGARTALMDIVSISGSRVLSIVLALVSVTLVTHMLTPQQYSALAYVAVISNLMFTATSAWLSTALIRFGREELEETRSLRATSWAKLTIMAPLLPLAGAVVIVLKLCHALPAEMTWPLVVIAVATGISLIGGDHVLSLLEANGRMRLTALALTAQRLLSILGVASLLVVGFGQTGEGVAAVWLVAGAAFGVVLGCAAWRVGLWPATVDRDLRRRMVMFSLPLIAFAVSQYLIQAVDIFILGLYRPARDVGLYSLAYQGYGVLQQLANTATIVLSPLFVSLQLASHSHVIRRFYIRLVPQALYLVSLVAGISAAFLRIVVPVIFGHGFARAALPLSLLIIAWLFFCAESFVAAILVLHKRSRAIAVINSAAAVLNVLGDWLLVGVVGAGIWAPAASTAVSLALIAYGYFVVSARALTTRILLPLPSLLPGLTGVTIALLSPDAATAALAGTLGTCLMGVAVAWLGHPFAASDADIMEKLNIPEPAKRGVLALVRRLG